MTEMLKTWEIESQLHHEVMEYKEEINQSLPKDSEERFDLEFHTQYLEFLDRATSAVKKLQKTLTEKHTND
jgi:hypothetical protein